MSDAAAATGADDKSTDAEPDESASQNGRGLWFLLLVGLVVVAGAGYYWAETIHPAEHEALNARVAGVERDAVVLGERLEDSADTLEQTSEATARRDAALGALESSVARVAAAQRDLEGSVKALYQRDSSQSLDWILAEVEYLILAASQRLALERDVDSALAALGAADRSLRAAEHPELIDLRERLTRDIAALEAVDAPDVEGLALYLADAVTRVADLPTRPIADLDMSFSHVSEQDVASDDWRGAARALWADLKSLVEVKDGELEDGVLFDPKLRYFLQQNLRLELASARLAVLRRDTANFHAAGRLVIDLLDTYYDSDAGPVRALRERIASGLTLELDPPLPAIAPSLDAVRAKRDALREAALAGN